ncbi:MAG: hypothetical protein HKP61_07875 [Dactylosporangium sp.]|nr:hypothetical protein [Dactylosporangium sp.]NNJ60854.1 hypothetical protein [Dactylosporangium sp.]
MLELLSGVAQTPWIWPTLFCVVALDALCQCLPSATMVILAGLSAAAGQINVGCLIAVVGLGAFVGDNLVYRLGERTAPRLLRHVRRGRRGRRFSDWAEQTMSARTVSVIVTGRYLSGARLAVMLTARVFGIPPRPGSAASTRSPRRCGPRRRR